MAEPTNVQRALAAWSGIPSRIRRAIRGLSEADLERRGGSAGWSIRETVHHLVEANLIASNMIVAALATDGGDYDWTWVNPDRAWMRRVGYDTASVDTALKAARAVGRHVAGLVASRPGALARSVKLNDAPGAPRYVMTVEKILRQEVEHAREHLGDIRAARRQRGRRGAEAPARRRTRRGPERADIAGSRGVTPSRPGPAAGRSRRRDERR